MTRKLTLRVLQQEQLPCGSCGGRCCTYAPFTPSELRAARLAAGGSYPPGSRVVAGMPAKARFGGAATSLVVGPDGETCAFLAGGRCSIYEARPRACRDYGRVPEMPCEVLHPREAARASRRQIGRARGIPA